MFLDDDDDAVSALLTEKSRGAPAPPGKPNTEPDKNGQKGKGCPWTSAEYVQLFQRVEELGKKAAFEGFPGRTKNQASLARRLSGRATSCWRDS